MAEHPVGIHWEGHAVAQSPEMVPAIVALAEAVKANAEAISVIARHLEGTPGITNSAITGTSISQTPAKTTMRKRRGQ